MAEEEIEKNQKNPLMIVIVVLLVILLLIIGGLSYLLLSKGVLNPNEQTMPNEQQMEKKDTQTIADQYFKAQMNDLVLNITNAKGREKLMKLSFTIKSAASEIEMLIDENKAEIIDTVIAQVSARSSEELLTAAGKELLKEELISDINIILNQATTNNEDIPRNSIKDIYFTAFVIK